MSDPVPSPDDPRPLDETSPEVPEAVEPAEPAETPDAIEAAAVTEAVDAVAEPAVAAPAEESPVLETTAPPEVPPAEPTPIAEAAPADPESAEEAPTAEGSVSTEAPAGEPAGPPPPPTPEQLAERAQANLETLRGEVGKLAALKGRAFWEHVKNVNGLFRSLRPLPTDERKTLWDEFSATCEVARAERAAWNEKADENARLVENEIEALVVGHVEGDTVRFGEFWGHSRRVRDLFKTTAPLRREDRRKLWERFKTVCSATRKEQNAATATRRSHSHTAREAVEALLADARARIPEAADQQAFTAIRGLLDKAMEHMRGAGKPADDRMVRPDARACWEAYKAAGTELRHRMESVWSEQYAALEAKVQEAVAGADIDAPLTVQARVKEAQTALREVSLDKSRRERLRKILSDAWLTASRRIQEERDERRQRHDDWVRRMEERVTGWEELLSKNDRIIESLESQVEDLEKQIEEAWSDTWAERARGWIEEKRQKIEAIRATSSEVSSKMEALRRKLPRRPEAEADAVGDEAPAGD